MRLEDIHGICFEQTRYQLFNVFDVRKWIERGWRNWQRRHLSSCRFQPNSLSRLVSMRQGSGFWLCMVLVRQSEAGMELSCKLWGKYLSSPRLHLAFLVGSEYLFCCTLSCVHTYIGIPDAIPSFGEQNLLKGLLQLFSNEFPWNYHLHERNINLLT